MIKETKIQNSDRLNTKTMLLSIKLSVWIATDAIFVKLNKNFPFKFRNIKELITDRAMHCKSLK